ncbi:MAG: hypothetical protein R2825_22115 [Saprospiraceae bacterium]
MHDAKIRAIDPPVANYEERLKSLEDSKKKEATITLELIQLRIQMSELESADSLPDFKHTNRFLILKDKEQALMLQLAEQKKWTALLEQTFYYPEEDRRQALLAWQEEQKQAKSRVGSQVFAPQEKKWEKKYAVFSDDLDLINFPPVPICESKIEDDGRGTKTQRLFSHTDKKLENYFPKRDFIAGFGNFSTSPDGFKIFNLTLLVASPKADKIYGVVPAKEFIILFLLDGQKVSLRNRYKSKGKWDVKTQSYFYQCQYLIGPKEEKILKSMEVDKILVRWSKTSDEYEIFELDFFRNQLRCLENQ